MAGRHTEGERALLAALLPFAQGMPRTRQGGELVGKLFGVEAAIAPGNLPVIDRIVIDPVVVERGKQAAFDAGEQVMGENEVVVAQGEDVGLIGAIRRRRQPEQEAGREVIEHAPIGRGGGMVELVNDHVVEVPPRKALQVGRAAQGLHRSLAGASPAARPRQPTARPLLLVVLPAPGSRARLPVMEEPYVLHSSQSTRRSGAPSSGAQKSPRNPSALRESHRRRDSRWSLPGVAPSQARPRSPKRERHAGPARAGATPWL